MDQAWLLRSGATALRESAGSGNHWAQLGQMNGHYGVRLPAGFRSPGRMADTARFSYTRPGKSGHESVLKKAGGHAMQAAKRYPFRIALLIMLGCFANAGHAQVAQAARIEVIPIPSVTLTDQEFLAGREDGKPVTVAGELRLPRGGTDRLPLVILLHGSGGVLGYVMDWEQDFLSMGVATFVIDSFSSRGIVNTNSDQSQLGRLAQTEDAYRALGILSKHPRIDPTKVMLMGFSRGGQNALYASMKRFQRMHAPPGVQFAAYTPSIRTAPTRISKTKTSLPGPCESFMARLTTTLPSCHAAHT
ncbi:MAG: dienelactone hydrolase family protein [Ralstonia sp.]|jgi:hypothetical protein|uniref:dienelactone hydrolase family protein n=2 Tax=Ralstonia TaxID=48736 RepID=UPI00397B3E6B